LQTWRTDRAHRVDALVRLHHRVAAMTEIPALAVEQLGPMLVVTLAAKWQGFARDLHDDAVKHIVADVRKTHVPAGDRLEALLLRRRRLDRGNADHSALNDDFRLLGINRLWDRIQQYDAQAMDLRYKLGLSARVLGVYGPAVARHVYVQLIFSDDDYHDDYFEPLSRGGSAIRSTRCVR
jgi:hypothetical protein